MLLFYHYLSVHAEHQPSTANALIQYTPPQEADFSKQFLQMLARDAPTAGPFDPAQQSDWQRHGMGDMGAAFDSLNISHRPSPTTQPSVTIREHLPNSSPAGSGDNSANIPSIDSFGADLDLMDGGEQSQSAAAAALQQQPQQMQAATSLQQLQARQKQQQQLQQQSQQKQRSPRHYRAPQPRPSNSSTQPFIKPDPEPLPSPYLTSTQPAPNSRDMVLSNGNPSPLQMGFQPSPQSFPMDDLNMIPDVSLPLDVLGSATSADLAMPDEDSLANDSFWQQFLSDGPASSGGMPDASGLEEPGGASAVPDSGDAAAAGGGAEPSGHGSSRVGSHSQQQQQQSVGASSDGGLQNGGRPPSQYAQAGVSSGQPAVHNQQQQQQQQQAKRTSSLDAIKQLQEQLNRQSNSLPASFT